MGDSAAAPDLPAERELRELVALRLGTERLPARIRVVTDTTEFFLIDRGDILPVAGRLLLVRGSEREGRFGLDDEPKLWVKRAVDLHTGELKIVKLGFQERYEQRVGKLVFECVRSPRKEARLLELVRGHPNFMQGFSSLDSRGNVVRVIDFIRGRTFGEHVEGQPGGHEEYFFGPFRGLLPLLRSLAEAVGFLHGSGERHGDIRRDHVLIERGGGARWIDFDFNYYHAANPALYDLFGLGNLLVMAAGKGDLTLRGLERDRHPAAASLRVSDMNVVFRNRVVNLRKVYPYVPEALNRMLLAFSAGAEEGYESVEEFVEDLAEVEHRMAAA